MSKLYLRGAGEPMTLAEYKETDANRKRPSTDNVIPPLGTRPGAAAPAPKAPEEKRKGQYNRYNTGTGRC